MSLEDDIRSLTGVGLFTELNGEQLRLLAFGAERMKVSKGRDLYRAGQKADCAYVIVEGQIDLVDGSPRERRVLQSAGPGAMLGEFALISDAERISSAVAAEDSVVIRLNRSLFRRVLEEYPDIAERIRQDTAERLRTMIERLSALESRFAD